MPELPDLEVFRRYFDSTALHQKIREVRILEDRLLEDITPARFRERITGKTFESTHRHGKYLSAVLDDSSAVILHFGMTGFLSYYKESTDESRHPRVIFDFDNGYHLAYDNMRMLGKVGYTEDMDEYIRRQGLGPDAGRVDFTQFSQILAGKRGMIKSAFMDQSALAGLGNIYTDELLFHAGFHPKAQVTDLTERDYRLLFDTMQEVLLTAIEEKVNPANFPPGYLLGHRSEGTPCPKCGEGEIRKTKVSSRSTYFCPSHQE